MKTALESSGALEGLLSSLGAGCEIASLFDEIPGVHFFMKDRESRFIDVSPSFARLMDQETKGALIGKTDYDFSPKFLADVFYEDDQRVMSTGKPIRSKVELVPLANGGLDWLCTSKTALRDEDGEIVGLAGITRIIRDSESVYADHPEMRKAVEYVRENFKKENFYCRHREKRRRLCEFAGALVSQAFWADTADVSPQGEIKCCLSIVAGYRHGPLGNRRQLRL
jgi:hypothetical protein